MREDNDDDDDGSDVTDRDSVRARTKGYGRRRVYRPAKDQQEVEDKNGRGREVRRRLCHNQLPKSFKF